MRFYLYLLILCILSSLLPFLWQALIFLLVGLIYCAFIVTRAADKRLGFWQAALVISLLLLFLVLGWLSHTYLGVTDGAVPQNHLEFYSVQFIYPM